MKLLLPVALAIAIGLVGVLLGTRKRPKVDALAKLWPLEGKRTLLTESEQLLYRRLVEALPTHLVMAQVQLLQAVRFRRGAYDARILNRISQLSLDFLVLAPDTGIVAAIELDDASHDRERRKAADARKARALTSADIPLLRWNIRQMPDVPAIRQAIVDACRKQDSARPDLDRHSDVPVLGRRAS